MNRLPRFLVSALVGLSLLASPCVLSARQEAKPGEKPSDNIGHDRHKHHHNPKHPTEAPSPGRFVTSRASDVVLPLPEEKDAFTFVVYGDRTGGPVDGVKVLADAVRDTNLFEPDLVMTCGDLVNGYNDTTLWLEQMKEYKEIMGELRCPWFPVAGNHDVYWRDKGRGEARPVKEHEANFEMHFGPLWYAFEHKNSWFIALFSDETNPKTGEKNFGKPENHAMSDEQFNWLKDTLVKAKGAEHVFIFLHHPRWTGGQYGDQWDKVHKLLVDAGNVTAVFAGHIHRMRYDPKDGIEYVTLATVGGSQDGKVPQAGWLHQFHVITVRKQQVAMASVPVGDVMDVREITAELGNQCDAQKATQPAFGSSIVFTKDGGAEGRVAATIKNVTTRAIDLTVAPDSDDSRWRFHPDHDHGRVEAGGTKTFEFMVTRRAGSLDDTYRAPELVVNTDVLMPSHRYSLPERRTRLPIDSASIPGPGIPAQESVLELSGDDAVIVPDSEFKLPDGAFTLETWINAEKFSDRNGLVCKTEASDYGLITLKGVPEFSVFLGSKYVTARAVGELSTHAWHHVAGVFDGAEVRLYVDGKLAASEKGAGVRKTNKLPLVIGADVGGDGLPTSHFTGAIDGVRLTRKAMYSGESFNAVRRPELDGETVLLSNMDGFLGNALWSEGTSRTMGRTIGNPVISPAK